METSATSTKQTLAITSNQDNKNHNNLAQNPPKTCARPQQKQKSRLRTHQTGQVTSRSCSTPTLRKVVSLPHRLYSYLTIEKGQVKTKTCIHFKSKQWKSQQSCSKSSVNMRADTNQTKGLATHSPGRSSNRRVVFPFKTLPSAATPNSPRLVTDDCKGLGDKCKQMSAKNTASYANKISNSAGSCSSPKL